MTLNELHLEHAPIVEALIALDVAPLSNDAMSRIEVAGKAFQSDYPESEPIRQVQFQFGLNVVSGNIPDSPPLHDTSFGQRYVSSDKRQIVVFRRNGFVFSRLPPYERWESFREEARRLWDIYRLAIGSVQVVGFGLRYINRVSIPFGKPIDDYLRLYPHMPDNPDGSLRMVNSSYLRIDSIIAKPIGGLIIQQATLPSEREGFATLSLDFDLRFSSVQSAAEEYIWDTFESARQIKNQLFIDSLTPEFLETFR